MRKLSIVGLAAASVVAACSSVTPAVLAADQAKVLYFLQAAGCVTQNAAATAQQLGISSVLDAKGNAVLTAVDAASGKACSITVPAPAVAATPAS